MPEPIRAAARPALVTLLALVAGIVGALLFAPRTGQAVGGLSLDDRVLLTGTPYNVFVTNQNAEIPTVPAGRRLFIESATAEVAHVDNLVCTLGGHEIFRWHYYGVTGQFARRTAVLGSPIVLTEGQRVAVECAREGQPANDLWRRLYIIRASML